MGLQEPEFCIFNCLTGRHAIIDKTPFKIGSGADCDLRIDDPSVPADYCVIQRRGRTFYLLPANGAQEILLDGAGGEGGELEPDTDHTLVIGRHYFALHGSSAPEKWLSKMDHREWYVYDKRNAEVQGPYPLTDLAGPLYGTPDIDQMVVICRGLKTMGFYGEHLLPVLHRPTTLPEPSLLMNGFGAENSEVNSEYGEFTCPVCWLRFDRGDTMNIAVHASLRGDPVLGETQMQRFHATRFNDRGQALDAMGIPTGDLACPHCRRKLPPGFLDNPHDIFSIVGAPSAGKSYYLSVLVKTLQSTLFQQFGVSFRDADPSENVILNQMKTQLFSAASPAEALLAKTELEGAMYETLPRLGRKVPLPKPFIFNISKPDAPDQDRSIVFYDNAGEHFEPTRNSADSPGAQHIAAASGIFFLFDPLHNAEFRRRLAGLQDPQLEIRRMDQQDVILAETEVRMKNLLGLDSRQRSTKPLAVIVGKCDTWLHLLTGGPLDNPVSNGKLKLSVVNRNSARIRALLLEICPAIVANAESISNDVSYFAISPLGASPVTFEDERGKKMIGPDPQKLNPMYVEIPTLWVLSKTAPGMVLSTEA